MKHMKLRIGMVLKFVHMDLYGEVMSLPTHTSGNLFDVRTESGALLAANLPMVRPLRTGEASAAYEALGLSLSDAYFGDK